MDIFSPSRRGFLKGFGSSALFFTTPGLFAEILTDGAKRPSRVTANLTEGPYYPDRMPLDTDNDLLLINDAITPAVGAITHVSGRIMTLSGQPVRNAFVEIWQCDNTASYINTRGRNPNGAFDGNFQGYGRCLTDAKGQYYFRTIKPIAYTLQGMFRTPHIHVAVSKNGRRIATTQLMIRGCPTNTHDGILGYLHDTASRDTVLVDFVPVEGSLIGELSANFDVILGLTAVENDNGQLHGGIGKGGQPGPGGPGGPGGHGGPPGPPPDDGGY